MDKKDYKAIAEKIQEALYRVGLNFNDDRERHPQAVIRDLINDLADHFENESRRRKKDNGKGLITLWDSYGGKEQFLKDCGLD